jgi:hypothetical protein
MPTNVRRIGQLDGMYARWDFAQGAVGSALGTVSNPYTYRRGAFPAVASAGSNSVRVAGATNSPGNPINFPVAQVSANTPAGVTIATPSITRLLGDSAAGNESFWIMMDFEVVAGDGAGITRGLVAGKDAGIGVLVFSVQRWLNGELRVSFVNPAGGWHFETSGAAYQVLTLGVRHLLALNVTRQTTTTAGSVEIWFDGTLLGTQVLPANTTLGQVENITFNERANATDSRPSNWNLYSLSMGTGTSGVATDTFFDRAWDEVATRPALFTDITRPVITAGSTTGVKVSTQLIGGVFGTNPTSANLIRYSKWVTNAERFGVATTGTGVLVGSGTPVSGLVEVTDATPPAKVNDGDLSFYAYEVTYPGVTNIIHSTAMDFLLQGSNPQSGHSLGDKGYLFPFDVTPPSDPPTTFASLPALSTSRIHVVTDSRLFDSTTGTNAWNAIAGNTNYSQVSYPGQTFAYFLTPANYAAAFTTPVPAGNRASTYVFFGAMGVNGWVQADCLTIVNQLIADGFKGVVLQGADTDGVTYNAPNSFNNQEAQTLLVKSGASDPAKVFITSNSFRKWFWGLGSDGTWNAFKSSRDLLHPHTTSTGYAGANQTLGNIAQTRFGMFDLRTALATPPLVTGTYTITGSSTGVVNVAQVTAPTGGVAPITNAIGVRVSGSTGAYTFTNVTSFPATASVTAGSWETVVRSTDSTGATVLSTSSTVAVTVPVPHTYSLSINTAGDLVYTWSGAQPSGTQSIVLSTGQNPTLTPSLSASPVTVTLTPKVTSGQVVTASVNGGASQSIANGSGVAGPVTVARIGGGDNGVAQPKIKLEQTTAGVNIYVYDKV